MIDVPHAPTNRRAHLFERRQRVADVHSNAALGACPSESLGLRQLGRDRSGNNHVGELQQLGLFGGERLVVQGRGMTTARLIAKVRSIKMRAQDPSCSYRPCAGIAKPAAQLQHRQRLLMPRHRRRWHNARRPVPQVRCKRRGKRFLAPVHEIGACRAMYVHVDISRRNEPVVVDRFLTRCRLSHNLIRWSKRFYPAVADQERSVVQHPLGQDNVAA
jgi:hypothetical protein